MRLYPVRRRRSRARGNAVRRNVVSGSKRACMTRLATPLQQRRSWPRAPKNGVSLWLMRAGSLRLKRQQRRQQRRCWQALVRRWVAAHGAQCWRTTPQRVCRSALTNLLNEWGSHQAVLWPQRRQERPSSELLCRVAQRGRRCRQTRARAVPRGQQQRRRTIQSGKDAPGVASVRDAGARNAAHACFAEICRNEAALARCGARV